MAGLTIGGALTIQHITDALEKYQKEHASLQWPKVPWHSRVGASASTPHQQDKQCGTSSLKLSNEVGPHSVSGILQQKESVVISWFHPFLKPKLLAPSDVRSLL